MTDDHYYEFCRRMGRLQIEVFEDLSRAGESGEVVDYLVLAGSFGRYWWFAVVGSLSPVTQYRFLRSICVNGYQETVLDGLRGVVDAMDEAWGRTR